MAKNKIDENELQEAKEAFEEMRENFEFLKRFFRRNCDLYTWDRLKAYSIGNIDLGLLKEGEYIGGHQSFEETLEDLENQTVAELEENESEED